MNSVFIIPILSYCCQVSDLKVNNVNFSWFCYICNSYVLKNCRIDVNCSWFCYVINVIYILVELPNKNLVAVCVLSFNYSCSYSIVMNYILTSLLHIILQLC